MNSISLTGTCRITDMQSFFFQKIQKSAKSQPIKKFQQSHNEPTPNHLHFFLNRKIELVCPFNYLTFPKLTLNANTMF